MQLITVTPTGSGDAFIYQRHTGRILSKKEFEEDLVNRVRHEVNKYNLFTPGDTILAAISGGKDSFTLINILSMIHSPNKIIAVTIIEGIKAFDRVSEVEKMKPILRGLGIDYRILWFRDYYRLSMDEVVGRIIERGITDSPCTFCGVLKRRILNIYARDIGASRVATAHNLDDEAQTLLMNILRGDESRLPRLHPRAPVLSRKFVPRIKPLRRIYEYETTAYAYMKGFKFQVGTCPYVTLKTTLRSKVRELLYRLENISPGFMLKLVDTMDRLLEPKVRELEKLPDLPRCVYCGEPTSYNRRVCKVCELLSKLGIFGEDG